MWRLNFSVVAVAAAIVLGSSAARAHSGGLDANGCHYEKGHGNYHCHQDVPANPDVDAVAKKSRDNVCHDRSSPNYRSVKYFISYRSMKDCQASGGRKYRKP